MTRVLLRLAGFLAHLASAIAVTPKIHALRVAAGGAIGRRPAGDPAFACLWDLFALDSSAAARASRDTERGDF